MANAVRVDPFRNFNFLVEIQGITQAGFTDCSGFGASNDPIEYREGGHVTSPRKLPGMTKYSNIILKWGVTDDRELYDWHQRWVTGDPQAPRANGSIILLDRQETGQEKVRWNFKNAWPAKWTGPSFNAEGNDVAIETLELAHEGLERA